MSATTRAAPAVGELSGLSELVQQAEQLTAEMDSTGELPRVERNLRQLLEAGQQLWSRTAQTGVQEVSAAILLGSKGVDLPAMTQRLESLSSTDAFQPLEPIDDTDVHGFLRNERQNAILAAMEESKRATYAQVDHLHWERFQARWELEKQTILSSLASSGEGGDRLLDVSLQPDMMTQQVGGRTVYGVASTLSAQEMAYVDQVECYLEAAAAGGKLPCLVELCHGVAERLKDSTALELWDATRCVVDVTARRCLSGTQGRFSTTVQTALIERSLRLLETDQLARVRQLVFSDLQGARLGGVPGIRQLVQSYLSVRPPASSAAQLDDVGVGPPVWPLVFQCMRCGDPAAARDALQLCGAGADVGSRQLLADTARWLDELVRSTDGRVAAGSEAAVRLQYRRTVASSTDPYKRAVFALLGATDGALDIPEVTPTTDDFIWLKLACLRALSGDAQLAALASLQIKLLEEYGESHFDAYNQPVLYFRVLLLTGQLEAALEFLARVEDLRAHALHIALALHQCTLLQLPESTQAPLISRQPNDPAPRRRLNLVRLTLMYTRRFETTEPEVALHYLLLLRRLRCGADDDVFGAAVTELVLQSSRYESLLGKIQPDGARRPGTLDRYGVDPRPVVTRVATACEDRGLLEDAVQLYDLAGNHHKLLELLNRLLSQLVPQPSATTAGTTDSQRRRLQLAAIGIAKRFKEVGHSGSQRAADTLFLLLDLMSLFDLYHAGRGAEALAVLRRLRLVSLSADELERRVDDFSRLDEEVRRCIPDILLAAMSLLHSSLPHTQQSRLQACALLTFAGSIPYRLPGDTHARLTKMQLLMN